MWWKIVPRSNPQFFFPFRSTRSNRSRKRVPFSIWLKLATFFTFHWFHKRPCSWTAWWPGLHRIIAPCLLLALLFATFTFVWLKKKKETIAVKIFRSFHSHTYSSLVFSSVNGCLEGKLQKKILFANKNTVHHIQFKPGIVIVLISKLKHFTMLLPPFTLSY